MALQVGRQQFLVRQEHELDSLRPSAAPGFLCDTGTADAATRAQRRDTRDALLGLLTLRLQHFLPCIYAQFTLHLRSFTLRLRSVYALVSFSQNGPFRETRLRSIYARFTLASRSEPIFCIARLTLAFTLAFTLGQRGSSVSLAFTLLFTLVVTLGVRSATCFARCYARRYARCYAPCSLDNRA